MTKLLVIAVFFTFAVSANADLEIRVKTQKDGTEWTVIDPSLVTHEVDVDTGLAKVYPTTPDPNSICYTDLQEWYIMAEDGSGWHLISFLASAVGIRLPNANGSPVSQYWKDYGYGGSRSPVADRSILSLPRAVAK